MELDNNLILSILGAIIVIWLTIWIVLWNKMYDAEGRLLPTTPSTFRGVTDISNFVEGRKSHNIAPTLAKMVADWGKCGFVCMNMLGRRLIVISDPEMAAPVLRGGYEKYPKSFMYDRLKFLIGDGLLTSNGKHWQHQRRLLNKSFHIGVLKEMLNAFARHSLSMVDILGGRMGMNIDCGIGCGEMYGRDPFLDNKQNLNSDQNGNLDSHYIVMDAQRVIPALTLDILMECGFGVLGNVKGGEYSRLIQAFADSMEEVNSRFMDFNKYAHIFYPHRTARTRETNKIIKEYMDEIMEKREVERSEIFEKCETREEAEEYFNSNIKDLLDVILNGRDFAEDDDQSNGGEETKEGCCGITTTKRVLSPKDVMSDSVVYANAITFLFAGHETTAGLIQWAFQMLCEYPEHQETLFEEATRVFDEFSSNGGEISGDNDFWTELLNELVFTKACVTETLRLHTPGAGSGRKVAHETKFSKKPNPDSLYPDGKEGCEFVFKPNTHEVFISIHGIHTNPNYWEDPHTWNPDRWMDPEKVKGYHPYQYIPFSAGPRNCIGQNFAKFEAILIISLLVKSYRFELHPSADTKHYETLTTRPSKLVMKVFKRF